MDSASVRVQQEASRKEELQKQIERLQAELATIPQPAPTERPNSPKRKQREPTVLAPATPSPRKKRRLDNVPKGGPIAKPLFQPASKLNTSASHRSNALASSSRSKAAATPAPQAPQPSNFLQKLAQAHAEPSSSKAEPVNRSTSFAERAEAQPPQEEEHRGVKRDERLMLIDEFEPGPYDFTPSSDDPTFEKLEPHSNIVLASRSLSHEDFANHLCGRFYVSPSRLYSSIRLQPDKQAYDIPVPGDWVTIAVVAERGPVRMTRAPVALGPDEDADDPKNRWKKKAEYTKPNGKHFVALKLVDFGARTKSSATAGKAVIRGDAFLSLLLFEADAVEKVTSEDGRRVEKVYRGGSKGAYEMFDKLKPGDVIALLNPKILKPYQRSSDKPHPVDNILALTPESASSIAVLGKARDLGRCNVRKKDGNTCGRWVDKRVSEVCDYHVQSAVQHRRAARPEFTAGTGGMTNKPTAKRKTDYDPARQWGLKPDLKTDGSTYIVSGHIVGASDSKSLFATENIGREGQAKAKRKLDNAEADKLLKQLAARDREGMEAVMKAREVMKGQKDVKAKEEGKSSKGKGKGKEKEEAAKEEEVQRKAYSTSVVRSIGFDPTVKAGQRRIEANSGESKFEALQALSSKRSLSLGKAPKKPEAEAKPTPLASSSTTEMAFDSLSDESSDEGMIDLDDL
ncbi:hypothetical protein BKA70DRAFT_1184627 [Coprinopsis sp. MPI-PUGE-AT-0042]|nr:hypothetical protein BKA70DRAFT_1184627 [Coprinopsis sp. MPI-PUGE-AT-0042]